MNADVIKKKKLHLPLSVTLFETETYDTIAHWCKYIYIFIPFTKTCPQDGAVLLFSRYHLNRDHVFDSLTLTVLRDLLEFVPISNRYFKRSL